MAARKRLTLDVWIRDAMTDERDGRKCSMIALVHMIGQQQKEIHHVKFASGKSWQPDELASMFRGRAEGFAQDLSGSQTFQLLAFYGTKEAETFQPFTVSPVLDPDNLQPSEPATVEGKLQQHMRQSEMMFQQVYRRQQVMDEHAIKLIEMQSAQILNLTGENRASFALVKEVLMAQALDTHKHRMDELGYSRASEERKKWISYLPMLANTVLGREIFPQSNADTVLLEQVVEGIDENAIMMLAQFVKPELMGPLMSRFTEISQRKQLEAKNQSAAMTPVLKGEEDIAGGEP